MAPWSTAIGMRRAESKPLRQRQLEGLLTALWVDGLHTRHMGQMAEHQDTRIELAARLDTLEAELRRLRSEVGVEEAKATQLPCGEFYALRMKLADDSYGVPIGWVREIVRYVELTRIADVPPFVVGTINYRGEILPVIDGRVRFGLPSLPPRRGTAIVLVRVGHVEAGLIVDAVQDVVLVSSEELRPPSGPLAGAKAVAALATVNTEVLQLLDLGRLMSATQWERVRTATTSAPPLAASPGPLAPEGAGRA